jgi:outer membrane protein W
MKKLIIIVLLCVLLNAKNYAQNLLAQKDKFFLGWEVAVPTNDLISGTSWSGGRFEYRRMVNHNISVGIGMSWNSFDDYVPRTTYQKPDGTGAVTTDLVKDVYTVPITLSAHYYFDAGKKLLPYIGLGLGTEYADQNLYFNIFGAEQNNWGFVARPEIGLIYPFNTHGGIYLNAAYNYATNKNDIYNTNSLAQFAVSLGFVFGSR